MTCTSVFRVQWVLAALAGFCWTTAALAGPPATGSVYHYTSPAGETYYALSLKAHSLPTAQTQPQKHIVLVDTSASQFGEHRQQGLDVVKAFISRLPAEDQVAVLAVDVQAVLLTEGFVAVGEATAEQVHAQLQQRAPLGATNLPRALTKALDLAPQGENVSVFYIGDGMSTAHLVLSRELSQFTATLRSRHIPMHSYAVGPQTDLQLLGILGLRTGGVVRFDQAHEQQDAAENVAGEFVKAVKAPVFYPTEFNAPADLLPGGSLPLRTDRDTVFLGKGKLPETVPVSTKGNWQGTAVELSWNLVPATSTNGGDSYLAALYNQAEQSQGMTVYFAGTNLLNHAQDGFNTNLDQIAALGERAVGFRQLDDATQFALSLDELDPGNVRAQALFNAIKKIKQHREEIAFQDQVPPAPVPPGPVPPVVNPNDLDPLSDFQRQQAILDEQMQATVAAAIQQARALRRSDPDRGLNLLKDTLGRLQESGASPNVITELTRKIGYIQADLNNQRQILEDQQRLNTEKLVQLRTEQRLLRESQLLEELTENRAEQVRAYLDLGRHGDDDAYNQAVDVAEALVDLRPGSAVSNQAFFTAQAATQLNRAFRMRAIRADRFLETLYLVETSHVPFPDEPPIRWPAAEVWRNLTERRRKWASVDLHKTTPAEERISQALKETTEVEFIDTPLQDAMEFLGDLHNITIILDTLALDEEGIQPDEPVNQLLSGTTLRSALRIILGKLGLRYLIQNEVMIITTETAAADLQKYGQTRVYPVGDLVVPIQTPLAGGLGQGLGGVGGFQGQGGLGQGGQFGQGSQGFGGFGGQGQQGGGFFSLPPQAVPNQVPGQGVQPGQQPKQPKAPQVDPETKQLLDNILGPKQETSQAAPVTGQFMAQVKDELPADQRPFRLDNEAIEALKKKQ